MSFSAVIASAIALAEAGAAPVISSDAAALGFGADGKLGAFSYVSSAEHIVPLATGETITRLVSPTKATTSRGRSVVWRFPGGVFSGAAATGFMIEKGGPVSDEVDDAARPGPGCTKKASTRQANAKPLRLWRCGAQTLLTSETSTGDVQSVLSTSTPFEFVAAQPDPHGHSAPVILGRMVPERRISLVVLAWNLRH